MIRLALVLVLVASAADAAPKRVVIDAGPDLPWPCWIVRWYAVGKTVKQLEAEGKARGIVLSPKQRRQAAACFR